MFTGRIPVVPENNATGANDTEHPAVVALGGGHGLYASLQALRYLTTRLTAVVTVADDGGSSGRLRQELGVLPPGDLRMALAALCEDNEWGQTWRDVMQHRFSALDPGNAELHDHAVGNLLIVALWELLGDPVKGLAWAGALLGARGTVLPMATEPLTIAGDVYQSRSESGEAVITRVQGQSALAVAGHQGNVHNVELMPSDVPACPQAVEAVHAADWVVLGPGSWYTSLLPHVLLPQMREALETTKASKCLIMNLSVETSETTGMSAIDHLLVLKSFAPALEFDVVVADPHIVEDNDEFIGVAAQFGARVVFSELGVKTGEPVHEPLRLAATLSDIFRPRGVHGLNK